MLKSTKIFWQKGESTFSGLFILVCGIGLFVKCVWLYLKDQSLKGEIGKEWFPENFCSNVLHILNCNIANNHFAMLAGVCLSALMNQADLFKLWPAGGISSEIS